MKVRFCGWVRMGIYACVCGCLAACGHGNPQRVAGGSHVVSMPTLERRGADSPVTEISDGNGRVALFRFRDGRMVGGYSTAYGSVVMDFSPLEIEVADCTANESGSITDRTEYRHFRMSPEGYVVAMEYRRHVACPDREPYLRVGSLRLSYTPDGHIVAWNHVYDDSKGQHGIDSARYSWRDGNLKTIFSDFNYGNDSYVEHRMVSFAYSSPDSLLPNNGVYWELMMSPADVLRDFMWYGGLLGRPTKDVPVRISCEVVGDKPGRNESWNVQADFDSLGRISSVRYGDSLRRIYAYGAAEPFFAGGENAHEVLESLIASEAEF